MNLSENVGRSVERGRVTVSSMRSYRGLSTNLVILGEAMRFAFYLDDHPRKDLFSSGACSTNRR